jgi:hypothetical protein
VFKGILSKGTASLFQGDWLDGFAVTVGAQPSAPIFNVGSLPFSWNVGSGIHLPKDSGNSGFMHAADLELAQKPWTLPPSCPSPQPKPKRSRSNEDFALAA